MASLVLLVKVLDHPSVAGRMPSAEEPVSTLAEALGHRATSGTASGGAAEHLRRGNASVGFHSTIMHTYSFTELKTNPSANDLVLGA